MSPISSPDKLCLTRYWLWDTARQDDDEEEEAQRTKTLKAPPCLLEQANNQNLRQQPSNITTTTTTRIGASLVQSRGSSRERSRMMTSQHPSHLWMANCGGVIALFVVLVAVIVRVVVVGEQDAETRNQATQSELSAKCGVFNFYGNNDLTPVDVVVKHPETNIACIKARFSLAIKVEEASELPTGNTLLNGNSDPNTTTASAQNQQEQQTESRIVLGYLPLDHVISVEDSCPDATATVATTTTTQSSAQSATSNHAEDATTPSSSPESEKSILKEPSSELEMIVTFDCGKLAFTFSRNETSNYLTSIKGIVMLDRRVVREFRAERKMFVTSRLERHFKYDDLIEVSSEAQSKAYLLTANFYYTEIETFRETTNRDFVHMADENSVPFSHQKTDEKPGEPKH